MMMTFILVKIRCILQQDTDLFSPLKPLLTYFTKVAFLAEPETMIESHAEEK